MISLVLSILSSTLILWVFKIIEKQKIPLFPPIVVNYIAATLLGFSINGTNPFPQLTQVPPWLIFSLLIGIFLIVNFYLIGRSTQKAGIAVTTIAAKMSFVIPVLFSLLYDINDTLSSSKVVLIVLAVVAVFLVVRSNRTSKASAHHFMLPIAIFMGLGFLDSLIKYCQYHYIGNAADSSVFSGVNFGVAGIIGLVLMAASKNQRTFMKKGKVWLAGTALGVANFGSMYFLINALNELKYNNSLVFGINNIGIVTLSVLMAYLFFKERFSTVNWIGLALAVLVLLGMIQLFV